MGAFKGEACLSQAHIRENAKTLVVNIKKWDLWTASEGALTMMQVNVL